MLYDIVDSEHLRLLAIVKALKKGKIMYQLELKNFDIVQICNSGQCFRMEEREDGNIGVIAGGRYLEVKQKDKITYFSCTKEEFEQFWKHYFDLDKDYDKWIARIDPKDNYLNEAVQFGSGIRILNQDLWEMIITFLLSQQNNIKRIRKCIQALCENFGKKRTNFRGEIYFDFPTPEALFTVTEEQYRNLGFGYRSRYLVKTVQSILDKEIDLQSLFELNFLQAKKELLKLTGVGEKVADCICLFALHQMDAFPMDTHMKQICEKHYNNHFPLERYKDCAGLIQQYLFYYDLLGAK